MSSLKVLITSGGGLLGRFLNIELSKKYTILSLYHNRIGNAVNFNPRQYDLTDFKGLKNIIYEFKPNVIIHNAAISNSAKADMLPRDYVYKVNVKASERIAELCNEIGCRLIYTSTDLVYNGSKGGYLKEDAELNPLSFYAETKLEGENVVVKTSEDYVILRTALMYGIVDDRSDSHFTYIYQRLKEGRQVELFVDQFRSPLALAEGARIISEIIEKNLKRLIINFGGCERLSRYDLGLQLCRAANFDETLIVPTEMKHAAIPYKVEDVSMDITKLQSFGIVPMTAGDYLLSLFTNERREK